MQAGKLIFHAIVYIHLLGVCLLVMVPLVMVQSHPLKELHLIA